METPGKTSADEQIMLSAGIFTPNPVLPLNQQFGLISC